MKFDSKTLLLAPLLLLGMLLNTNVIAQTKCCKSKNSTACGTEHTAGCSHSNKSTSGCSPSNCRGAKTKFGEAKVITKLRGDLISLKADMEKSKKPVFEQRSYDIHGIVGESDDESLQIIVTEVKMIEEEFKNKLNQTFTTFALPEVKAKQIQYLSARIKELHKMIS